MVRTRSRAANDASSSCSPINLVSVSKSRERKQQKQSFIAGSSRSNGSQKQSAAAVNHDLIQSPAGFNHDIALLPHGDSDVIQSPAASPSHDNSHGSTATISNGGVGRNKPSSRAQLPVSTTETIDTVGMSQSSAFTNPRRVTVNSKLSAKTMASSGVLSSSQTPASSTAAAFPVAVGNLHLSAIPIGGSASPGARTHSFTRSAGAKKHRKWVVVSTNNQAVASASLGVLQSSATTKTGVVDSTNAVTTLQGVVHSSAATQGAHTGKFSCPLQGFDGCKNGCKNGRGFCQGSLIKHLRDKHYPDEESKERCRQLISNNFSVFKAWEVTLHSMQMWLCTHCMQPLAWSKSCKHTGEMILRPWNGKRVEFLVHGISCPAPLFAVGNEVSDDAEADTVLSLNLDLLNQVLQSQICTVASIPAKCKLLFARTFNAAIQRVINNPNDISLWVQLLLFPICTLRVYFPKDGTEERSGNRKKLQIAAIQLALKRWSEPNGCVTLLLRALEEQTALQEERHKNKRKNQEKSQENQEAVNIRLCRKKLSYGLYTAAIRTLTSNGVAPSNSGTLEELQAKHPHAAPPMIPTDPIAHSPFVASKDLVLNKMKSFPKGTSCGRDGLRAQHLMDALSGSAAAVSDELIDSITELVNIWLAGGCPPALGEFVASAPLTPLLKPGGGIRPIAVGTIWRRLVSKVAASHVGKKMESYLSDFQFGVGVPCGGESILHAVNRLLEVKSDSTSTSMLLVDFSNAFNLVSRSAMIKEVRKHCPSISKWVEFCYAAPARLYYMDKTLSSAQGVQQGDPLGPLLFALTLHPLIHRIADACSLDLQAWYLDDGTLVGDTLMVAKALDIIQQEGVSLGLHLNVSKTELFWPTVDSRGLVEGVFPSHICRPSEGVKLLGGPVSLSPQFCKSMVVNRVHKTTALIDALQKLKDPQGELLLLRNCSAVSRLYFAMRTTKPEYLDEAQVIFDNHLKQFLRHLVTGDGPGFGLLQQRLVTLPIRYGGLGVYTMEDTMRYCFLASYFQTKAQQENILRVSGVSGWSPSFDRALNLYKQVCGIEDSSLCIDDIAPHSMSSLAIKYFDAVKRVLPNRFAMTERDSALWQSNRVKHAQDYLLAIPIAGLNQKLGSRHFRAILRYRLGIPLFEEGDTCTSCGREMDIFGDHALHCSSGIGLKYRHDLVRDTFADICYRAGVPARKEVDLGFISDTGLALRPADILVYNWNNGHDVCMDITVVSPFTGVGVRAWFPGKAIDEAVDRKKDKYLEKCTAQGFGLGVLAFTTLGELGSDTVEFLKRLRNYIASHDANVIVGDFLFHRIGVVLQKGIGAQLVARLPSKSCNPVDSDSDSDSD